MTEKIFDRETFLDLLVNVIPLGIIAFFIVGYAVYNPFGVDLFGRTLQYALLVVPFVALTLLTYLSAKAIVSAEMSETVYLPGAATVEGAEPVEERVE